MWHIFIARIVWYIIKLSHIRRKEAESALVYQPSYSSESEEKNLPKEEAEKLKNSYIPYVAWTRLFSGTNFQETSGKITIGSHGVGAKAAVIFSTKFVGTTDDGKKKCIVALHKKNDTKLHNFRWHHSTKNNASSPFRYATTHTV